LLCFAITVDAQTKRHDYPTQARVEYVYECIARVRGTLAEMYKCSCVIDKIAESLSYDEFVEAGTFARYSGLGGDRAGVFRDPDQAKQLAARYRKLEADSFNACHLPPPT
jgi:hypothetical protein